MREKTKLRIVVTLLCLSILSAGALLARHYHKPTKAPSLREVEEKAMRAINVGVVDQRRLPPQGDLSDEEYARELIRLREQSDSSNVVRGGGLRVSDN